MFKGFNRNTGFNGFPSLGFQARGRSERTMYGKNKASFWLEASLGLPSGTITGSRIVAWNDQIGNHSFEQQFAVKQPVFIEADPNFNNFPVVHVDSFGRGLITRSRNGPSLGVDTTVAIVYQYIGNASSLYSHNTIIGEFTDGVTNIRTFYRTLNHGSPHGGLQAIGYWFGGNSVANFVNGLNGNATVADFLPRILIISRQALIHNGISYTKTHTGSLNLIGNQIGAGAGTDTASAAGFAGNFKLAELIIWNVNYSVSDCLDISAELNAKYAIY